MIFKPAFKEARVIAGMTQEDAAKKLSVSQSTLSCWESGKSVPRVTSALEMSAVYGVSLGKLCGIEPLV